MNNNTKHPILQKLDDYIANASEEQLRQDWEDLKQYNQGGPEMLDCLNNAINRNKNKNMNRGEFIEKLQQSAGRLAKELGCNKLNVTKGNNGVWDTIHPRVTMTDFLEKNYGDCTTELHFTNEENTIEVETRFRFEHPCISVRQVTETAVEDGTMVETNFIELEFDDAICIRDADGNEKTVRNGNFRCVQVMLWDNWDILRDRIINALDDDIKPVVKL